MFYGIWKQRTREIIPIRKFTIYKKTCVFLYALFIHNQQYFCINSHFYLTTYIKPIFKLDFNFFCITVFYSYICDEKSVIFANGNNNFKYYYRIYIIKRRNLNRDLKRILCFWKCFYVNIGYLIFDIKL